MWLTPAQGVVRARVRAELADVEGKDEEGVNAFMEGLTKPVSEGLGEPNLV